MPGWDILQQPFPQNYQQVAPVVNEPRPLPPGEQLGGNLISAFVHSAIARRQADLEQQQQVQNAALTMRGQDIQKENNLMDYEVGLANAESIAGYRDSTLDLRRKQASMIGTGVGRQIDNAKKRADFLDTAGKTAHELKLEDLKFQGEHPMWYAKNALGYQKLYGGSIDPTIKAKVAQYTAAANASKVSLPDDTGKSNQYSWAEVIQDIERNSNSPFIPRLQAAGLFDTQSSEETFVNAKGITKPKNVTRTPKGDLKRMLEDTKGGTPLSEIDKLQPQADTFSQASEAIMNKPVPYGKGATPAAAGPLVGTKGTINGTAVTWDGYGWAAD